MADVEIIEYEGPQGGRYYSVRISGNRKVSVSQKPGDDRVWIGREDEPGAYRGQRGGVGRLDDMIEENRARLAGDPEARELWRALRALEARKAER